MYVVRRSRSGKQRKCGSVRLAVDSVCVCGRGGVRRHNFYENIVYVDWKGGTNCQLTARDPIEAKWCLGGGFALSSAGGGGGGEVVSGPEGDLQTLILTFTRCLKHSRSIAGINEKLWSPASERKRYSDTGMYGRPRTAGGSACC